MSDHLDGPPPMPSVDEVLAALNERRQWFVREMDHCKREIARCDEQLRVLGVRQSKPKDELGVDDQSMNAMLEYFVNHPGASLDTAARALQRSPSTVSRYVRVAERDGLVSTVRRHNKKKKVTVLEPGLARVCGP